VSKNAEKIGLTLRGNLEMSEYMEIHTPSANKGYSETTW